jgi:hypothetical protein
LVGYRRSFFHCSRSLFSGDGNRAAYRGYFFIFSIASRNGKSQKGRSEERVFHVVFL